MAETLIYEPVRLGEKIAAAVIAFAIVYLPLWVLGIGAADYRFEYVLTLVHAWTYYFRPIISLMQWQLPTIETAIGIVIVIPSALFAGVISKHVGNPRPPEKNVRGRRVIMPFKQAASAAEKSALEDFREGEEVKYHLHSRYPLARERLTRGICYAGSQGSGKTQAMLPLISEAIKSALQPNSRTIVFIHDFKGDFTEYFAGIPGVAILAPWDSRSLAWDIAPDILSKSDARELAANLTGADIATGQDISWASGSAQILSGLIINLIKRKPNWKWSDLLRELDLDYLNLREHAIAGEPSAAQLMNEGSAAKNPTISFTTRLSSMVKPAVEAFANAETTATQSISFRRWFLMEPNLPRVLIGQNSTRFEQMARAILKSATKSFASALDSIPDNSRDERFLFFDELPQCGKMPSFPQFFSVGRSKGCMPVYSFQIINQLNDRNVFGPDITKSISGMTGTTVICRVQSETQKWASELVGERSGDRLTRSDSRQGLNSNTTSSTTISYQPFKEPVLTPESFGHEVGVIKKSGKFLGVSAFLLDNSNTVFRLAWPPAMPKKTAPAHLPAPWTTQFSSSAEPEPSPASHADAPAATLSNLVPEPSPSPVPVAAPRARSSSSLDELDSLGQLGSTATGHLHAAGAAGVDANPLDALTEPAEAPPEPGPGEAIGEHMAGVAADAVLPGLGILLELASTLSDSPTPSYPSAPASQQFQTVAPPPAEAAGSPLLDEDDEEQKD
jgi:hypothetical protein